MANSSRFGDAGGEAAGATDSGQSIPFPSSSTSAPETAARSTQGVDDLGAGLKDAAKTAAGAIKQQAAQLAQDVGHELSQTGEGQKLRGAEAMRRFARAIDSAAAELESQSPAVAQSVHEAARRVEGLSDNLASRNVNVLIDSAAQLARAQPALFIGGSVAAGFALARFLKSSARHKSTAGCDPYQR